MLQKITIIWKKGLSKSCLKLNFLQISQWARMSISHQSGARGMEKLIWLKYLNVQKMLNYIPFGAERCEKYHYMKKRFN